MLRFESYTLAYTVRTCPCAVSLHARNSMLRRTLRGAPSVPAIGDDVFHQEKNPG